MFLDIRSPNGAGEYSVEFMAESMKRDHPDTPVLDLAKMPRGQGHLLSLIGLGDDAIPTDPTVTYGGPFTRAEAQYVLDGQAMNPSIGQVANALMVWHEVMGSQLPPNLPAKLEDMVDAVQQGHDHISIAEVAAAPVIILQDLEAALLANPNLRTDKMLVTERLGRAFGDHMATIRSRMAVKRPTETNKLYTDAVRAIRALIKAKLFALRAETDLCKKVKAFEIPKPFMEWAKIHVEDMNQKFRAIQSKFTSSPYDSPFRKVALRMALSGNIRQVVEEKIALLDAEPNLGGVRVVAMYKFLVEDYRFGTLGSYDQVVFRSAGADVALFDRLGEVIRNSGLFED
jgi:hypothetical protein